MITSSLIHFSTTYLGGINATALLKFVQAEGVDYKMAIVTDKSRYVLPEAYFSISHGHIQS